MKIENSSCPKNMFSDFYGRFGSLFFDITPLKTNMSPENWWLEDDMSFWDGPFLGDILIFGGVTLENIKFEAPK